MFLRNPSGGVECLDRMRAAGFGGVLVKTGYVATQAATLIRSRVLSQGMVCVPWARVQTESGNFSQAKVNQLIDLADEWGSPFVVHAETQLKASGERCTSWLDAICGR